MGEVFRARDTRLDRTVAIKICTGHFTERFEREARAISSLNHPHICALYDIGREGTVEFLVMEYLEGESLEARLRKGPIPIEEALQIAIQIAGALDAAHRRGMVHRDLKPGNVMLTRSGAKLLDFGLAKMNEASGLSGAELTQLTAASPITVQGTILGTLQYMSPEQLEGKEADARSDIFSFGAMLYEMITGRKGFAGSSQATLIAAVMMTAPPPVSTLQPMASPALDRLVRKCLAKSPDARWQCAGDLLSDLEWIAEAGSEAGVPAPVAAKRRGRERMWQLAAGLAAALLIASAVWIAVHLRNEPAPPAIVQFNIPVPDKLEFFWYQVPAISPDGQRIAFTASEGTGGSRLFVRPLNAAAATEIPTPGVSVNYPFWSFDGQQIVFHSNGTLQKVDLSGGPPVAICSSDCGGYGGTWNRDEVILSTNTAGLLYRVSATGGDAKPLRPLAKGETAQFWPEFLPDGKHYLYFSAGAAPYQQGIYVASLDSNDRTFIVATTTQAAYLQSGQLLFIRGSVLMAQPFDPGSLKLSGGPRPVADHLQLAPSSTIPLASFAASPSGVVVWRHSKPASLSFPQWLDRDGKKLAVIGEPADYSNPSLSPDDSKLAVCIRDPQTATRDIWIFDLVRGGKTRLTFDPADDVNPVWSPDGTRIAFTSDRSGQRNIYWKLADGSGPDELLLGGNEAAENVEDWSRDGKYLIYNLGAPGGNRSALHVLPLAGERKPVTYLDTRFASSESQFSPNGRWVAYYSTESGKPEVYVQGFNLDPSQPLGKWQVSTAGGELPRWGRDGKELYYRVGTQFFAVEVKTDGPSFQAGVPKLLFETNAVNSTGIGTGRGGSPFGVSSDGKRFLVLAATDEKAPSAPIDVVVNWR
jgi:Tol biopolymer transport system component